MPTHPANGVEIQPTHSAALKVGVRFRGIEVLPTVRTPKRGRNGWTNSAVATLVFTALGVLWLGTENASACAARIYVAEGGAAAKHIAILSSETFAVLGRINNVAPGGTTKIWGLSGKSDGSRIYAALDNGELVAIDGVSHQILRRDNVGSACPGVNGVASFPNGSRLLVICANRVVLFAMNGDVPTAIDTVVLPCSTADGYDLQVTGSTGVLHIACQGPDARVQIVRAVQDNLVVATPINVGCQDYRDVCLQNANLGCDEGGIVCDTLLGDDTEDIIAFQDAGCPLQVRLEDSFEDTSPTACSHTQNGSSRFWIASANQVALVKPFQAEVVGVSLPFNADLLAPNLSTGDTTFVVGAGGVAEVDSDGAVLRSSTGLAIEPEDEPVTPENIFVPAGSPAICGLCP